MELCTPKPKKYCRLPQNFSLPIALKKDGTLKKFKGLFNGFNVIISDEEDMKTIISQGYFGKANFSRSYPQFAKQDEVKIIRNRQFENRKKCFDQFPNKPRPAKVIAVPDSDSENEDYFTNLQPQFKIDYSGLQENVWLGLEESFFLTSAVKCLDISYKEQIVDIENIWTLFSEAQPNFVRNYLAYYYYRAKNWVVKSGIKFGGDFLLYKQGPPFFHASYVVIIEVIDENGDRRDSLTNRSMDNLSIAGLNRLCETAGKELLICRIKWPQDEDVHFEKLRNFEIQEILVRRWIPSQERGET